ncbi:MAG: hypothetical protein ACLFWD_00300 [Anaerolineales bacterium]
MKDREARREYWISLVGWWLLAKAVMLAASLLFIPAISPRWSLPLVVLAALAFLLTRFVELSEGFRLAGLQVFALLAGMLVAALAQGQWQANGRLALAIAVVATVIGMFAGRLLPPLLLRLGWLASGLTWIYVLSWFLWWRWPLPEGWGFWWAAAGLLMFFILTAFWSAGLRWREDLPEIAQAGSQLFLLSLNLTLSALFLLSA